MVNSYKTTSRKLTKNLVAQKINLHVTKKGKPYLVDYFLLANNVIPTINIVSNYVEHECHIIRLSERKQKISNQFLIFL